MPVWRNPLRRALGAAPGAHLVSYRAARLVSGSGGIPSLGDRPTDASAALGELTAAEKEPAAAQLDAV